MHHMHVRCQVRRRFTLLRFALAVSEPLSGELIIHGLDNHRGGHGAP